MPDLGRRLLHDPQSDAYTFRAAPSRAGHVRHRMNAPHVDQFYLGACVGFSGVNMLNCVIAIASRVSFNRWFLYGRSGRSYLQNADGIENYSQATRRDPWPEIYPPDDTGSSALGLMRFWKEIAIIDRYEWTRTFPAFLAALQRQPVLVGSQWYDDMMTTDASGVIVSSASGNGGGHEYLATEIIPDGTRIYGMTFHGLHIGCEQSWGENSPDFGCEREPGRFFMPALLAEELIIHQQGDVAVPQFL